MERIAVATALDDHDQQPFAAALQLARLAGSSLVVLNVHDAEHPADWHKLPTVRSLLERWHVLPAEATVDDFAKLGLRVQPVAWRAAGDAVQELVVRVGDAHPDLLVMGTGGRVGLDRLLHPSVAEPVAREWGGPTLFISQRGRSLIDAAGRLMLRRVLVPIDASAPQQPIIDALARLLQSLEVSHVSFILLHVGAVDTIPAFELPPRTDWMWRSELLDGDVVDGIVRAAAAHDVDLIAMGTRGHDSWLDALRGSTTERVLRRATCPLLALTVR
jgi:nucleotide-binding universal stress UspA family protein